MLSLNACDRSCLITLLAYSSINDNGMIAFLSEEQLMIQAGISPTHEQWDYTVGILEKLKKLDIISINSGVITIKNWQKRQETNLSSYERVKKFRQKKHDDSVMKQNDSARIDKNRIEYNKKENKETEPQASLPSWLNKDTWAQWEQHKKEKKSKLTKKAIELQIKMLSQNIPDHVEIIETSIRNGYHGLFPLKKDKKLFNKVDNNIRKSLPVFKPEENKDRGTKSMKEILEINKPNFLKENGK